MSPATRPNLCVAVITLAILACGDNTHIDYGVAAPTAANSPSVQVASQCHYLGSLPDPACTPGRTNPDVTQANIADTICVKGWTKTIRPPVAYTSDLKRKQMTAYGDTESPAAYEEDHLIPLELGGHPTDPANLWPQPLSARPGAHEKDRLENYLRGQVCAGRIQLADVQSGLAVDWVAFWVASGRP